MAPQNAQIPGREEGRKQEAKIAPLLSEIDAFIWLLNAENVFKPLFSRFEKWHF